MGNAVDSSNTTEHKTKYRLAYVAVTLVILAFFIVLGIKNFRKGLAFMERSCVNSISTAEKLMEFYGEYSQMQDEDTSIQVNLLAESVSKILSETYESSEDWKGYVSRFNARSEEADNSFLAVILPDGEFVTTPEAEFPSFTDEQLRNLELDKPIILDGYAYAGKKTEKFFLLAKMMLGKKNIFSDVLELSASDIMVFDSVTGDIIATNSEFAEKSVNEVDYIVDGPAETDGYRRGHFKSENDRYSGLSRYFCFVDRELQNGQTVCACYPLAFILDDEFTSFFIPFVLTLIFAFVCLNSCIGLAQQWRNNNISGVQLKLFGLIKINGTLSARVVSMLSVCGLIALALSSYFVVLPSVTNLYVQSEEVLETVENLIVYSDSKKQQVKDNYEENMLSYFKLMEFFGIGEDGKLDKDVLKWYGKAVNADAVTIFDADGNIEYDTKNYTPGYKLSSDSADPEYALWKLLNGEPGTKAVYCDNNLEKIYFAKSRSDKAGIERITINNGLIADFSKMFSHENSIGIATYPKNTVLVFGKTDNTEHLTCYNPATKEFTDNSMSFSDDVFTDGYNGLQAERGGKMHLITKVSGDNIYIIVNGNYNGIVTACIKFIGNMLLLYLVVSLMIIKAAGINKVNIGSENVENASSASDGMLVYLDKTITKVFLFSLVAVILLVVLDTILMNDSADLKYLLINNNKGMTLYTIGYVFFASVFAIFIVKAVGKVSQVFCRCIPIKKVTFCQLFSSLIKLVVIVYTAVLCLKQIGISTAQMLTFLGVSGVALGLGAKDIVTDFIAGAFIILDHNVNVGDYIEVSDFFGKVVEINIRTTKIQYYNKIISINNSNMRNVINKSAGLSKASISVLISYKNKIDDYISLINRSGDRYLEADINHILTEAPSCRGIVAYEKDGARVDVTALVRVEKKKAAERLLNTVTKKLMEENNIIMPDPHGDDD